MTRLRDIPRSNLPKALKDFLNAMEAIRGEDYGSYKMKKGPTGSWIFDTQNMPEAQLSNLKAAAFNAAKKAGITKIEASAPATTTVASAFAPTPSTSIPTPTPRPSIREVLTEPAMPVPSPSPTVSPDRFGPATPSTMSDDALERFRSTIGQISLPDTAPAPTPRPSFASEPAPDRFAGDPNDYMGTPTNDRFGGTPVDDPGGVAERLRSIYSQSSLPASAPTPTPAPRPASVPAATDDRFGGTPEVTVTSPISPAGSYVEATAPASVPAAVANPTVGPGTSLNYPGSIANATPQISNTATPQSMTGYPDVALNMGAPGPGPLQAGGLQPPDPLSITGIKIDPATGMTIDPNAVDPTLKANLVTEDPVTQPVPEDVVQPLPEPINVPPPPTVFEQADAAPVMASPVPSLTPRDIYGGTVGTAVDNTGNNTVSRDNFGTTSVTNQFGATTAMTPGGYQSAYGSANAPAWGGDAVFGGGDFGKGVGRVASGVGDSVGGSLRSLSKSLGISNGLPGIAKAMMGLDPGRSFASQKRELMGKLVGTIGGGALAGPAGALGGGWLGGQLGAQYDFPDAPPDPNAVDSITTGSTGGRGGSSSGGKRSSGGGYNNRGGGSWGTGGSTYGGHTISTRDD